MPRRTNVRSGGQAPRRPSTQTRRTHDLARRVLPVLPDLAELIRRFEAESRRLDAEFGAEPHSLGDLIEWIGHIGRGPPPGRPRGARDRSVAARSNRSVGQRRRWARSSRAVTEGDRVAA